MTDHAHCAHTSIVFPVSIKKVFTDLASFLVPIRALLLGLFLFSLNNVAIGSAWLRPPSGYRPFWMHRASDAAQYLTWARAFRSQVLIPDYHAPWPTTPGLFNPLFWFIGKSTAWFGFSLPAAFLIFHLALHIVAAYAFFFALEVFTTTATQKIWSFLVVICSVPLGSLTFLPRALLSHSKPMPVAGMVDFVWWSSDGFFHGIGGSFLVTLGTATTLLVFSLLGKYLQTEHQRWLVFAAAGNFVLALVHPFEIFLTMGAGAIILLVRSPNWCAAIREIAIFVSAGALGLSFQLWSVVVNPWIAQAAIGKGLPAFMALFLLASRPGISSKTDLVLAIWFVGTLIGIYIPGLPWSQHLLDGFEYVAAILLVRQLFRNSWVLRHLRLVATTMAIICVLSLSAYSGYVLQSFRDGRSGDPEKLFSAVVSEDELAAIHWMRQHAKPEEVIMAPANYAPWFATVPMHSVGSHFVFSLKYREQREFLDRFYAGALPSEIATASWQRYRVRYIVVPARSQALGYLTEGIKRADFGSLSIYEVPSYQWFSNVKGSISAPPLSSEQWRVSHHMQTLALSPAWPHTKNP